MGTSSYSSVFPTGFLFERPEHAVALLLLFFPHLPVVATLLFPFARYFPPFFHHFPSQHIDLSPLRPLDPTRLLPPLVFPSVPSAPAPPPPPRVVFAARTHPPIRRQISCQAPCLILSLSAICPCPGSHLFPVQGLFHHFAQSIPQWRSCHDISGIWSVPDKSPPLPRMLLCTQGSCSTLVRGWHASLTSHPISGKSSSAVPECQVMHAV
mmetsp:Transcript_41981/g.70965  ORF Transcript_41981/g.70965 Transcript_41981/m.70965 type:complete len:210 (-) Transcript_41981:233-862(-)